MTTWLQITIGVTVGTLAGIAAVLIGIREGRRQ